MGSIKLQERGNIFSYILRKSLSQLRCLMFGTGSGRAAILSEHMPFLQPGPSEQFWSSYVLFNKALPQTPLWQLYSHSQNCTLTLTPRLNNNTVIALQFSSPDHRNFSLTLFLQYFLRHFGIKRVRAQLTSLALSLKAQLCLET